MAGTNLKMLNRTNNNEKSDECYTPEVAILPLIVFLNKDKIYYECTSRLSNSIVKCLNKNNFKCLSSGNRNFLIDDIPKNINIIITNPPFSKKDKFIKKCFESNKPFALLLPISSLQGQFRGKMFKKHGIELLVLNKRIDFTGKGAPHFGVAWFCHKILPKKLIFVD